MKDYLDDFRMNMKYYREKNNISQTQLAIICDCGTGTIGGIESGQAKPSFDSTNCIRFEDYTCRFICS